MKRSRLDSRREYRADAAFVTDQDTVVFFGSARVHSREWAQQRLARAPLAGRGRR
jgi:hypothetical protein